jgi:predicted ABC-type exoprotein transport system permease subunit
MGKLKYIFGKPRHGIHSNRIFGLAAFDTILTILAAAFISVIYRTDFIKSLFMLLVLGELAHLIVGLRTPVTAAFIDA